MRANRLTSGSLRRDKQSTLDLRGISVPIPGPGERSLRGVGQRRKHGEHIRVTPIRVHELFIAKLLPPLVIGLGSLLPSLLVIRLLGVSISGSIPPFEPLLHYIEIGSGLFLKGVGIVELWRQLCR